MFQVRELSIKLATGDEARSPLFACKICDSTADVTTCGPTGALDLCTPSPESVCPTHSAPLFACNVCDSTPGVPDEDCPTISMAPLFACNVCDSTPEGACGPVSVAAHAPGAQGDGLQLLREQLHRRIAQLN